MLTALWYCKWWSFCVYRGLRQFLGNDLCWIETTVHKACHRNTTWCLKREIDQIAECRTKKHVARGDSTTNRRTLPGAQCECKETTRYICSWSSEIFLRTRGDGSRKSTSPFPPCGYVSIIHCVPYITDYIHLCCGLSIIWWSIEWSGPRRWAERFR